jgi:hypothetical protein
MATAQEQRDINRLTLMSFVNYCAANPDLRFWQALANWSGHDIFASPVLHGRGESKDTWEWTGPRG